MVSRWEGVRLPRASGKCPDFPGSSPNFPGNFSALPKDGTCAYDEFRETTEAVTGVMTF